jgi:hypothetical protein
VGLLVVVRGDRRHGVATAVAGCGRVVSITLDEQGKKRKSAVLCQHGSETVPRRPPVGGRRRRAPDARRFMASTGRPARKGGSRRAFYDRRMAPATEVRHSLFLVPPENRNADFAFLFSPSSDGRPVSRIVGTLPSTGGITVSQHPAIPSSGNSSRSSNMAVSAHPGEEHDGQRQQNETEANRAVDRLVADGRRIALRRRGRGRFRRLRAVSGRCDDRRAVLQLFGDERVLRKWPPDVGFRSAVQCRHRPLAACVPAHRQAHDRSAGVAAVRSHQ